MAVWSGYNPLAALGWQVRSLCLCQTGHSSRSPGWALSPRLLKRENLAEKCLEEGYGLGVRGIVLGGTMEMEMEGEPRELAPSRAILLALGLMVRNSICPSPLGLIMPTSWLGVLEGLVIDP